MSHTLVQTEVDVPIKICNTSFFYMSTLDVANKLSNGTICSSGDG
jgi:hypothetical protein